MKIFSIFILTLMLASCGSMKKGAKTSEIITTSKQMASSRHIASFQDSKKSHICSTLTDVRTPTMKHEDGTKYFITVGVIGYRIREKDDRNGHISDLVMSRLGEDICIDSYTGSSEGQYFYVIGASVREREKRDGYLADDSK